MTQVDRDRRYFLTATPAGVSFQLAGVMEAPVFLTWEQAQFLLFDLERLCDEHAQKLEDRGREERS